MDRAPSLDVVWGRESQFIGHVLTCMVVEKQVMKSALFGSMFILCISILIMQHFCFKHFYILPSLFCFKPCSLHHVYLHSISCFFDLFNRIVSGLSVIQKCNPDAVLVAHKNTMNRIGKGDLDFLYNHRLCQFVTQCTFLLQEDFGCSCSD